MAGAGGKASGWSIRPAKLGARRWELLNAKPCVRTLGAVTGIRGRQPVSAGPEALFLSSGWPMVADAANALRRADRIAHLEGDRLISRMAPIVANAGAGFGPPLIVTNPGAGTRSSVEFP